MKADLHLHTTFSDGVLSPAGIVRRAAENGVSVIAVTDHDTLGGIAEAIREGGRLGVTVIPGIEISAGDEKQIHILGYGVSPQNDRLRAFCDGMRAERLRRLRAMADRLAAFGMPVPVEEIIRTAGSAVGRPHLARAMIARGYVPSMQVAFDKWLGAGKPAYVPREKLPATDVINMLLEEHAVPVLAHPALLKLPDEIFLPLFREWTDCGLMGVEVYHPEHRGQFARYDRLARENGLLVTGGSDYHDDERGMIGETSGDWTTANDDVAALFAACEKLTE